MDERSTIPQALPDLSSVPLAQLPLLPSALDTIIGRALPDRPAKTMPAGSFSSAL